MNTPPPREFRRNEPLGSSIADRRVVTVLESSVVLGMAGRALAAVHSAAESSRLLAPLRHVVTAWRELGPPLQRLALGVALLTAAVAHIGLTPWRQTPPGWLWLIVPGMAAAVGGLLIAASFVAREGQEPR